MCRRSSRHLTGWCAPLDEVPDEVFAGRMLGDGLAIDPTSGIVFAPCDGEIVTLPESAHAVSIRSPDGLEVLIHIGIDTVRLGGSGFDARVKAGCPGPKPDEELIRFDLDLVARGAKSLMTPIVVTSEGASLDQSARRRPGQGGRRCCSKWTAAPVVVRLGQQLRPLATVTRAERAIVVVAVAWLACPPRGAAGAARQRLRRA